MAADLRGNKQVLFKNCFSKQRCEDLEFKTEIRGVRGLLNSLDFKTAEYSKKEFSCF